MSHFVRYLFPTEYSLFNSADCRGKDLKILKIKINTSMYRNHMEYLMAFIFYKFNIGTLLKYMF